MGLWVDWSAESYPSNRDFAVVPFFALFFPALRLFLDAFIFEKLARRLIFGEGHAKLDLEAHHRKKKIKKFKEAAWKCVYFLSAEILALSVSYDEPWFTSTKFFWVGPGNQVWPDQKIKLKLKGLYMYASGFYTYSLVALFFWETRRSDFLVSMGHHVASILLLVLSYMFRFARVGSIILALHDASDVFMEVAKMSKYSGYERIASCFFLLFALAFTAFRIIYFPFWILRSTSYEVLLTLGKDLQMAVGPLCYYVFNTLLFCLLVINLYWWLLLCGMLARQVRDRGQISDDVRSDSEGDDDDHRD
ncbi:ceramide synthase 1 LOH3-like [Rhodamnia argentea]|uniref:Ceramide synthase 1 LOH3-like n=1 Tax=Rhodamnia argentea TaxID=178133 RepID=A0A8B8NHA8_9MYRT|nr:ceramide synthase 1 LOH3-like [Rhodamnia argentea]XP_048138878.1 ceramide synthase 1 LOH3-like [Rhodamnia argentea]XP_048138879.1 ceramide synthase 1 LOH3-like [Rhodamnia argentea]